MKRLLYAATAALCVLLAGAGIASAGETSPVTAVVADAGWGTPPPGNIVAAPADAGWG
ncbi:hypothetical protein [Streptomyces sp. NPDC056160]|uniref:hypothetical protein n=1 Tax=Streptomyces sp. NPDC056160 TaxID=3345731 RepID=UPI0035DD1298